MKKVIILTGDELRHVYFRTRLSHDGRFTVVNAYCEGTEHSLEARTFEKSDASFLEKQHVLARTQAENDFFFEVSSRLTDRSNPIKIKKGEINSKPVVDRILTMQPDLLVCYGSSLIKSGLLEAFGGRFLNVHLGLSPYYRGSGTNVWPLINGEPDMVGATFMHIDAGIDTGNIIHQIRAECFLGDSPHSIGNRLIRKMTDTYCDIIARFDELRDEAQPEAGGRLYKQADFDAAACERLYQNFRAGMIERYIAGRDTRTLPYIVRNKALRGDD